MGARVRMCISQGFCSSRAWQRKLPTGNTDALLMELQVKYQNVL